MKKAIVFGATSGIGKSLTEILIKEGYQVAVTGRRLDKLTALKKSISSFNFGETERHSGCCRCRKSF